MGVVFEAFDTEREATVAIKTLPDATSVDLYRFKNEFRSLANLAHPNLVILHELISDGSRWFFSMEFVEGVNFLEYVRPDPWVSPADPSSTLDLDATHHTSRGDRTLSAFPETVDYQLPTLPRDPLATRTHTFDLDRTEDVDATRNSPVTSPIANRSRAGPTRSTSHASDRPSSRS